VPHHLADNTKVHVLISGENRKKPKETGNSALTHRVRTEV